MQRTSHCRCILATTRQVAKEILRLSRRISLFLYNNAFESSRNPLPRSFAQSSLLFLVILLAVKSSISLSRRCCALPSLAIPRDPHVRITLALKSVLLIQFHRYFTIIV